MVYGVLVMDLEVLLRAVRNREPGAWKALYPTLSSELRGYFRRDFDEPTAVELTQRVVEILSRRLPIVKLEEDSIRNWVFGTAHNQGCLEHRARARDRALEERAPPMAADMSPSQRIIGEEIWTMLFEEIERLPDFYRCVIENDLDGDMTDDELALQEGVEVGTIRTRRHRATGLLREGMMARMDGPLPSVLPPPLLRLLSPPPSTSNSPSSSSSSSSSSPSPPA